MPGKDYKNLLPLGSGSEDEDEDMPVMSQPEVQIHDKSSLLPSKTNGTGYNFSRSHRDSGKNKCCTATNAALIFAVILLVFGAGYAAGFFTPMTFKRPNDESHKRVARHTSPWRTKIADHGSESCIRLVDVDGDGLLDIITGLAIGKDISTMITEPSMEEFCESIGLKVPCAGGVIALRGYDGKLLWKVDVYSEVFAINCHGIDVNKDGTYDCLASGRLGTLVAIDPKNGKILWTTDKSKIHDGWNIYSPATVQDLDYDGVGEVVIAHGGDPVLPAENHNRNPGWLMLMSGATGEPIGRPLKMPESKEIYISPVIHERRDGSQYILFGSGGETVGGLFMAISLPDFYRHVHGYDKDHLVPNVRGKYEKFGFKNPMESGAIELYRSDTKGVMVPPVLTDVNKDGVKDIVMSAFDGTMILYCGETLAIKWKVKFENRESYSNPAPGYFNDDDVLDFMVHWSGGAWPYYNFTETIVIDGKDGAILWNTTSGRYDVTSDLTVKTTARNRDMFLFRVQGRKGKDPRPQGAIHGATGIQRVINNKRSLDGKMVFVDQHVKDADFEDDGIFLSEDHVRHRRADDYIECESDQTVFLAELFALDRTVLKKPVKLWERGSKKLYYKLTSKDRKMVKNVQKQYGVTNNLTELEIPWTRGKRSTDGKLCVMIQPDERTTGAFGDVDGDGKLDVIVNLISVGVIRDEHANFVKMKFDTDIFKINLDDAIQNQLYVPINATLHPRMQHTDNENEIHTLKFLPAEKQRWSGYMGQYGDSIA
ncbi:protein FAM234B-like [Saccostrea echinata]|uniref:protein FAM234B-like n=1 Tax=Saccostrea echinata TaxID=191078 RepID=UPI002A821E8F|nr:protein FAM234B-like [Saccostrea echinata]